MFTPPPIFTRFFRLFSLGNSKRKQLRPIRRTQLHIEQLESRDCPSAAPVIGNVVLDTTTPFTDDVIWATVSDAVDADNDQIWFDFVWSRNGEVIQTTTKEAIAGGSYETLALYLANYGNKGDAISLKVTPWDAYDTGTPTTLYATVANSPPVIDASNLASLQSFTGDAVELQIQATDADGDTITYSLTGGSLPPGLSMSSTGLITGTISASANTTTPYSATVTAGDGTHSDTQTFDWTIVSAIVVVVQGDQHSIAGEAVELPLSSWKLDNHTLTFSETGLPDGLEIDSETGEITGTIAYGEESTTPYSVTITATDSAGGVSEDVTFDWYVNAPEVLAFDLGDLESIVGANVEVAMEAWSTEGGTVTFSETGLPDGLSIDEETGVITGTIDSNADTNSPYAVTITATNVAAGISTDITFSWAVRQLVLRAPEDQANLIGDTVSLTLVAPYAGTGELVFSMTGHPDGLSINTETGEISGTIASYAAATTPYAITLTVTDGSLTQSKTFNWDVKELFVNDPGDQFSLDGDEPSLTFAVTQLAGHTITYAASDLPTGLSVNEDTGAIEGTIDETAHDDGPFNVTVTATDTTINVTASKTFTWVVDAPGFVSTPVPPVPVAPNPNRIARLQANIARLERILLHEQRDATRLAGSIATVSGFIVEDIANYVNAPNAAARANALFILNVNTGILATDLSDLLEASRKITTIQSLLPLYDRLLFDAQHPNW